MIYIDYYKYFIYILFYLIKKFLKEIILIYKLIINFYVKNIINIKYNTIF